MDSIEKYIKSIEQYFISFNIAEGFAYVLVKLPKKWYIHPKETLEDEFKTQIAKEGNDGAYYFFTHLSNGIETIFKCVLHIVETNNLIEEKKELFQSKALELKELFSNSDIAQLKTLKFVFEEEQKTKSKPKKTRAKKSKKTELTETKTSHNNGTTVIDSVDCSDFSKNNEKEVDCSDFLKNNEKETVETTPTDTVKVKENTVQEEINNFVENLVSE